MGCEGVDDRAGAESFRYQLEEVRRDGRFGIPAAEIEHGKRTVRSGSDGTDRTACGCDGDRGATLSLGALLWIDVLIGPQPVPGYARDAGCDPLEIRRGRYSNGRGTRRHHPDAITLAEQETHHLLDHLADAWRRTKVHMQIVHKEHEAPLLTSLCDGDGRPREHGHERHCHQPQLRHDSILTSWTTH
jgi:hypothetical protein